MRKRSDHHVIVRLMLDRGEIGGAVLDVEILDRALSRRHRGLSIHKIYFSATEREPHKETIGESVLHWHPVPYDKTTTEADRARLVGALRDRFVRLVDLHRPSLFVNHVPENPTGFFVSHLARDRGLPVFAVFHGGAPPAVTIDDEHERAVDFVAGNLRAAAGLADEVGAVSESAGRMMPMTAVRNVGTGADAEWFDPSRVAPGLLRRRFGFPAPLPVFLLAGRIVAEKGHQLLLQASMRLHAKDIDHRIVFAGSATARARNDLEEYLKANGFLGIVGVIYDASQEEMVAIYRDSDVVVLPTFHFEGCPRCLIEGQLMQKPVVATDSGGSREAFVPGETGLLVPIGDAGALADALEILARDPDRRVAMGRAGRLFAKARFDPDALAARHEAVYATMLEAARG